MKMKNELPKRKHPRLESFDYSSAGAYFITICTQNRRCVLSRIVEKMVPAKSTGTDSVGRGLAPAEMYDIEYSKFGKIAEQQLLILKKRYSSLSVDHYVIMPNHIHAIFCLNNQAAGARPRPTIMDIVCAYKSLTIKECKKLGFTEKLFQTSFHEHIIRGHEDYEEIAKYICENPIRWHYDELYSEE